MAWRLRAQLKALCCRKHCIGRACEVFCTHTRLLKRACLRVRSSCSLRMHLSKKDPNLRCTLWQPRVPFARPHKAWRVRILRGARALCRRDRHELMPAMHMLVLSCAALQACDWRSAPSA